MKKQPSPGLKNRIQGHFTTDQRATPASTPAASMLLADQHPASENAVDFTYYAGWRLIEERERVAPEGQVLGAERVARQFVDGSSIDEHISQDVYDSQGSAIAQTLYYHENARGDTVAVTDGSGNVTLRLAYSAYGEAYKVASDGTLEALTDGDGVKYSFQGREFDEETGYYYFRNRYYSTSQGRFLTRDPIKSDLYLYEAFYDSPYKFTDPLGEQSPNEFGMQDAIHKAQQTASGNQFLSHFITNAERYNLPTRFLKELEGKVSFGFGDLGDTVAKYNRGTITFQNYYQNLESIESQFWNPDVVAKVFHELFHAYWDLIHKDPCGEFRRFSYGVIPTIAKTASGEMRNMSPSGFINPPDTLVALEEAFGNKIEDRVRAMMQFEIRRQLGVSDNAIMKDVYNLSYNPSSPFSFFQNAVEVDIGGPHVFVNVDLTRAEHYLDALFEGKTRQYLPLYTQNYLNDERSALPLPFQPR